MNKTAINPWQWSLNIGYNQSELVEGATTQLYCAGQTSVDENGAPQHIGDMRGQILLAVQNLEAILEQADMNLSNVVRLQIFSTDVQESIKNFDVLGQKFGPYNARPPMTLLGVTELAIPGLMFEIEATAVK